MRTAGRPVYDDLQGKEMKESIIRRESRTRSKE